MHQRDSTGGTFSIAGIEGEAGHVEGIWQLLEEQSQLTASKEMGPSVLQLQETEICHNHVALEQDLELRMRAWLTP